MKKSIGLALSGGGVRGVAHLGVLKALDELGITISRVSGTSAGGIVGAFYCSGYKPDEIYGIIAKSGYITRFRPAWAWTGLLKMDGIKDLLIKYLPDNSFDKLKIPLTVAATQVRKGEIHYFSTGELIPGLLASATIPALFDPVVMGEEIYVDGGLLDNLPVKPLVGHCDTLIGSHCNPITDQFEITNVKRVMERSMMLAISVNARQSKALCNVVIEPPELGKFSSLDTGSAQTIFEIGYRYTIENQVLKNLLPDT